MSLNFFSRGHKQNFYDKDTFPVVISLLCHPDKFDTEGRPAPIMNVVNRMRETIPLFSLRVDAFDERCRLEENRYKFWLPACDEEQYGVNVLAIKESTRQDPTSLERTIKAFKLKSKWIQGTHNHVFLLFSVGN